MHRCTAAAFALLLLSTAPALAGQGTPAPTRPPAAGAAHALHITFIDVEGGQATLFVTPDRHSLLVDTGWPGNDGRDADRIAAAAHGAGLVQLDAVLLTHYHVDHTGGVPQLLDRIPVRLFLDHGPNHEPNDRATEGVYRAYLHALATHHVARRTLHPGERLPVPGLDATVVSGDGEAIGAPAGAPPNPACSTATTETADQTENARSLGVVLRWGSARIVDLGDLTRDKEQPLVCPVNRLGGTADLLVVSHHGFSASSSPVLIHTLAPRVAVMDNGATKGGSPAVFDTLHAADPRLALWQLHASAEAGAARNAPDAHLANVSAAPDAGYSLEVTVSPDATITVRNPRTGASESYWR